MIGESFHNIKLCQSKAKIIIILAENEYVLTTLHCVRLDILSQLLGQSVELTRLSGRTVCLLSWSWLLSVALTFLLMSDRCGPVFLYLFKSSKVVFNGFHRCEENSYYN